MIRLRVGQKVLLRGVVEGFENDCDKAYVRVRVNDGVCGFGLMQVTAHHHNVIREPAMIHPCACRKYNGGPQCYNCLNGAHSICSNHPKCRKRNSKHLGVYIIEEPKKRKRRKK